MTIKPKTYVITGATSDVGRTLCATLIAQGHIVREVSRATGVSLDDTDALMQAFSNVDGAYIMIPFDMMAADLHKREDEISARLAEVIKQTHVRRVVLLSAASAHLANNTGTSRGVAQMEKRLAALDIPELVFVRAGFYMENFIKGMSFSEQAKSGVYRSAFRPDRPMPMIASKDVGECVAQILTEEPFNQPRVRELLGAKDYTMAEATRVLGAAIGQPDMRYEQVSYDTARAGMLDLGVSPSFADAVAATARSFNSNDVWAKEARSPRNTTPITLEQFAKEYISANTAKN
jgi:uncharacterized protein YbjT (DUF2867 family)